MRRTHVLGWVCLLGWLMAGSAQAGPAVEKGSVTFRPVEGGDNCPECYRLGEFRFDYELTPKYDLPHSGVEVYRLTFPSPVKTKYPVNNTVHCEYFRPKGKGPFPAVIVLDILSGDGTLSRGIALAFAQHKVAALFVQMPYYGPRRPSTEHVRLLTPDIPKTLAAIRQTVLDCRCAAAWLETRREVDRKRLGIVGTSLGSFMSALTAAAEPRLRRVALLLSGGGLVDAYYDHPKAKPFTKVNELLGGSRQKLKDLIAPADPLTYAGQLKKRDLLMIAAIRDDVVPPKAAETLWAATGRQKIVWYNSTHVGTALYIFAAMEHLIPHFQAD